MLIDLDAQYTLIQKTSTLEEYHSFHNNFFRDGGMWLKQVTLDCKHLNLKNAFSDYIRFLTFVGMIVSQYGFPFLEGQLQRHEKGIWKYSPISPRHQLAVAVFMARLNLASYSYKESYIKALNDEVLTPGVWGMFIPIYNGKLGPFTNIEEVRQLATERIVEQTRAISLPDRTLNQQLASMPFTTKDAEHISDELLIQIILPKLEPLIGQWIDVHSLFVVRH